MQLTTSQVIDIILYIWMFGFLLLVLLDFIRFLPAMIRASLQPIPIKVQTTLSDPWDLPLQESFPAKKSEVVKDVATTKITKPKKSRRRRTKKAAHIELLPDEVTPTATPESSTTRLTFKKVRTKFADKGFVLKKFPSSRFRYRVADLPNYRFKKLEEALDWVNEQPELVEFPTHYKLELADTVTV